MTLSVSVPEHLHKVGILQDLDETPGKSRSWRHNRAWSRYNTSIQWEVITRKRFPHDWPFVRGVHRSPADSCRKGPGWMSFDVFVVVRLNKLLNKQSICMWFRRPYARVCVSVMILNPVNKDNLKDTPTIILWIKPLSEPIMIYF